ncbi:HEAT repeat domain-containing protein [bacterium]|nr:HEAT repeat domain-containing protein [bacterium]
MEWLTMYRLEILLTIITFIVIQFWLILILIGYALLVRLLENHRQNRQKSLNEMWYKPLFEYLEGDIGATELKKKVSTKNVAYFAEFIKNFFLDIEGDDKDRLTRLLVELNFDQYLINLLRHRNIWKRIYAAYFLGLINCQKAIPELRKRIFDTSKVVRNITIANLMQLKDLDSLEKILVYLGKTASEEDHGNIVIHLIEYGPDILPKLEDIFRRVELKPWIMKLCIDVFGHFVHFGVADELLRVYTSTDHMEVKVSCIHALANFGNPDLVSFFESQLEIDSIPIKIASSKALGELRMDTSIPKLESLVDHQNFWVAKRSIEAIDRFGEKGHQRLVSIMKNSQSKTVKELITETFQSHLKVIQPSV